MNEIVNNDELSHPKSTYMYKDEDPGLISMGPLWDFDYAYDVGGARNFTNPTGGASRYLGGWFFQRFFYDPAFNKEYRTIWDSNYSGIYGILAFISDKAGELRKSQELNARRWGFTDNYDTEIKNMSRWLGNRILYLNYALPNPDIEE